MKLSQICALAFLMVLGSVMAFADGIGDPKVIIHGAGTTNPNCADRSCVDVGLNFKFTVPESGSGTLFFTNTSGQNWNSLALIEKGVPAADIKCHSDLFHSCTTETLKNGSVEIFLTTGNGEWPNHGIQNGQSFEITFSCVQKSCWPGGLTVGGHANGATVPEPGTIALMVTGVGALVSRRKMWKNRWNC
ncbi:MAG: PEP-CTERM sorting domain-containing protein [Terriglobales bacterium]